MLLLRMKGCCSNNEAVAVTFISIILLNFVANESLFTVAAETATTDEDHVQEDNHASMLDLGKRFMLKL